MVEEVTGYRVERLGMIFGIGGGTPRLAGHGRPVRGYGYRPLPEAELEVEVNLSKNLLYKRRRWKH
ncbi:MAG: hypothetical protein DDT26_02595 [Dehalococcoidia bacterium]|nr:hypothetical protein [Chloroflexota bacterium]